MGNGLAKREIIYVEDIADACVFFMKKKIKEDMINIGTGKDFTIRHYAKLLINLILPNKEVKIKYDKSKPNGTPRKVMDISLAQKYGWKPKYKLKNALTKGYESYINEK